ncbi:MBL fold metallo-hydrolase [Cnuibacter physcomitrellae]|uniref:MBL fold metallo-hydrolase n=1 Tax=Cnuibacter physcomitrellae TaxID=1619308 RepID=UPI0021759F71|nr:MBL fold metallo-hydrolase [Cnuibacter physcomitrellae]MCS5497481.1 MBL fold metallo-hydrolase [Cnuibacter physcomitrellae]
MDLTVLGSATPYPRPDEPASGYLVRTGTTAIWLDAGPGTLAELQRAIALRDLTAIVISHQHADHTSDLLTAYYALRFAEDRPARPVPLYAPRGMLEAMTAFLGASSRTGLPQALEVRDLAEEGSAIIGGLEMAWAPVEHGMPAFGFTFAQHGEVLLGYSGDSAPGPAVDTALAGSTTVLIEAGTAAQLPTEPPVHHTPEEAGATAAAVGAARLVLTHIDSSITHEDARARARSTFPGEVIIARRGLTITL